MDEYTLPIWGTLTTSDTKDTEKGIEEVANKIYFYTEVDSESALKVNKLLIDMAFAHIQDKVVRQLEQADPIFLHINSPGGFVLDGLAIMDTIIRVQKLGIKINTVVDGMVASTATLFSVIGDHKQIGENSMMLIHQLSTKIAGTFEGLKDGFINAEALMAKIIKLYEKYTKIPAKELKTILERDIFFDAEKCLKYGLVDEII